MAVAFRAAGTVAGGITSASPTAPGGLSDGDVLLLVTETANQNSADIAAWELIVRVGTGTAGATDATQVAVYWTKYDSAQYANPVVGAGGGDHVAAVILAYSGVETVGYCYDEVASDTAAAGTAITFPSVTTTVAGTMIVNVLAHPFDDTSAQVSGWTNSNLGSLTERTDSGVTAGNGGGIAIADGTLASAGSSGGTTATLAQSVVQARATIALQPSGSYAAPSGPVVESVTTGGTSGANVSTYNVVLPATVNSGDTLVAAIASDQDPTVTWDNSTAGTWTSRVDVTEGVNVRLTVYSKIADGTEDGLTLAIGLSTQQQGNWAVFRISGAHGDIEVGTASSSGGTSTRHVIPPSVTASWGAENNLFLGLMARDDSTTTPGTRAPRYTFGEVTNGASSSIGVLEYQHVVVAEATQQPRGVYLSAGENWVANTLVIRPAAAGDPPTKPPGDITNPFRAWTSQAYLGAVATNQAPLQAAALDKPFNQQDWPVPKGATPASANKTFALEGGQRLLFGLDQFFGEPGETQARDFPNPLIRRVQQPPAPANFLAVNSTVAAAPFTPQDWPSPRAQIRAQLPTHAVRRAVEEAALAVQSALDLPVRARLAQQPAPAPRSIALDAQPAASPFVPLDLGNPHRYAPPRQGFDKPGQLLLVGQDQFFGAPGQAPPLDYPNPLRPQPQKHEVGGPSLATYSTPFVNTWTNPLVAGRAHTGFAKSAHGLLIGQDVFFGVAGNPFVCWPQVLPKRQPDATQALGSPLTLTAGTVTASPFVQTDWQRPGLRAFLRFDIGQPTQLPAMHALPQVQAWLEMPLRRPPPHQGFQQPSFPSSIIVIPPEIRLTDFPNPIRPSVQALIARQAGFDAKPFNPGLIQSAAPLHTLLKIPVINNLEQMRKSANAILEALQATNPGYGFDLPDPSTTSDGRLFVLNAPGNFALYQLQFGAWVQLV